MTIWERAGEAADDEFRRDWQSRSRYDREVAAIGAGLIVLLLPTVTWLQRILRSIIGASRRQGRRRRDNDSH